MSSPRTTFEHGVAIAFSAIMLGAATSSAQQSSGHWWAFSVYYGGAFTAFEVGSIGRVATSADIYGRNCTFGGCEEDPASVSFPGFGAAGSVGGGVLVRLADLVPEFRKFPVSVHIEARLSTIGTHNGRMLSAPLLAGLTW